MADEDEDIFSETEGAVLNDVEPQEDWDMEGIIVEQEEETPAQKAQRQAELEQQHQSQGENVVIKRGEYQIQVHVIEARDLKGEDLSGSSDPVCHIEIMGKKKKSSVKKNTLGCVYDERFYFHFTSIGREQLSQAAVKFSVFDANQIMRDTLIGVHQIDLMNIYYKPQHELYRQWIALMDYDNSSDKGVQGFLLVSVSVIGPGQRPPIHDRESEINKELSGDASTLVLLPPSIEQHLHFLVVSVYQAEDLPAMDSSGILTAAGIDAFVRVDFAGNPKCKTSVVTVKGEKRLSPIFLEELWIPVMVPTMAERISISVWDWDRGRANDLVGQASYSFAKVLALNSNKRWLNIYGPPLTNVSKKESNSILTSNQHLASCYRGRILTSLRVETQPSQDEAEVPHTKEVEEETWEEDLPETLRYVLRAIFIMGTDIPDFRTVLGKSKLQIRISIGSYQLESEPASVKSGRITWSETKEKRAIVLPADYTQLPDVFINLCRDTEKDGYLSVAFARIKASDLISQEFEQPSVWVSLTEEFARRQTRHAIGKNTFPGSILLRLGFGREEVAARKAWTHDYDLINQTTPCQLRVHVFQCKNLIRSDSNPYVEVNFNGISRRTRRKSKSSDPLFYETLLFDVEIPTENRYAPQISYRVMYGRKDLIGSVRLGFAEHAIKTSSSAQEAPRPQWHDLSTSISNDVSSEHAGQILTSIQVIEKLSKTQTIPSPASIIPKFRDAWIDITALGVRDMKPFHFMKIQRPYLTIRVAGMKSKRKRSTAPSNKPNGPNANFLERLILPVQLPNDPLYSPQLKLEVFDTRLGGLQTSSVASTRIDIGSKLPWNMDEYKPPEGSDFTTPASRTNQGDDPDEETKAAAYNSDVSYPSDSDDEEETAVVKSLDDGSGVGEFELKPLRHKKDVHDPAVKEMKRQEEARRYFAACADARRKGLFVPMSESSKPEEDMSQRESAPYLIGRDWWINTQGGGELEDYLKTKPFESYPLYRNRMKRVSDVGTFKGMIQVLESDPSSTALSPELNSIRDPKAYQVRLYILKAVNLQPKDRNGLSDPYLKVKLGTEKYSTRKDHLKKTLNPTFNQSFSFDTLIPGTSKLRISVWDYDLISKDDCIGETTIDLEDRLFHRKWQAISTQPIEYRNLWIDTCSTSQGMVQLWIDIFPQDQVPFYPMISIDPPAPRTFEVRLIVWKSDQVTNHDQTEMNDLFVTAWMEGLKSQSTDVHWRCSTGRAAWNYRLKFPVQLPLQAPEFGRLHVQLWDKDIVKWNDVLGETQIDLYKWLEKAYRRNETVLPFKELARRKVKMNETDHEAEEAEPDQEKEGLLLKKQKRPDNEAKEAVDSLLDLIGMGRLHEDADWVNIYHTNRQLGVSQLMGKLALSIQIVPEAEAKDLPVGVGRNDPNMNPYLPPPVGRMKMSANPFLMAKELVGPKTCLKLCCLFCCVFCMGFTALFGAGIMSTLTYLKQT